MNRDSSNRLEIYHSNRLERLLQEMARMTAIPMRDPLQPEHVVVQNRGMASWISQHLAQQTGISANFSFSLPAQFFWQIARAWIPDAPDAELFSRDALLLRVFHTLPDCLTQPIFTPLRRYLAKEPSSHSDTRLFQLAQRIADLLDQYLVFRPDQILRWEQGEESHWQAVLWRALHQEGPVAKRQHRARLLTDLERAMRRQQPRSDALPERLSLFGLTALAPIYMEILSALAHFIPVHLFHLNPCREYWSDLTDAPPDFGNPLLASLGGAGQVFLDQLLELNGMDHDCFEMPPDDTLLHQVQQDLLVLKYSSHSSSNPQDQDLSIQAHSAHGPWREIQILQDQLLNLFEKLDDLEPRDVIVMAPDMDLYAPYIESLFGVVDSKRAIPWSIANRRSKAERPLLKALKALLALPGSRFETTEILSLLQTPAIRRHFGVSSENLERLRVWIRESGIRWGEDATTRTNIGLPSEYGNSWAFGLDRLFLGYAMPPDADLFENILPYPEIEGDDVIALEALQTWMETLGRWRNRLSTPDRRPLTDWQTEIDQLLNDFFTPDEQEASLLQSVRDRLDTLVSLARTTEHDPEISLEAVQSLLISALEERDDHQHFMTMTGRVTFCNMAPMRSIPFRVVCLIGMNHSDFPRRQHPLSFDLMAQSPRRGDRSRRQDDRYLFLEAILSAREVLYLSYTGNDARDNSVKTPSVVVSELLDTLKPDSLKTLETAILTRHPLQPFSKRYFDLSDKRLFSYAQSWLEAAQTEAVDPPPCFIDPDHPLKPLDETDQKNQKSLDIQDLIRFLHHPARMFLTQRLKLKLVLQEEIPETTEPFDATGLKQYQLRQSLLRHLLAHRDESAILARLRGEGILPHGASGEALLEEQMTTVTPFLQKLKEFQHCFGSEPHDPLEIDLPLDSFRLQGVLRNLHTGGLIDYRFGKLRAKDRLSAWTRHLTLNCLAPAGIQPDTYFIAEDRTLHLTSVEKNQAETILCDLLKLRWEGLHAPLPFFPESAFSWLQKKSHDQQAWEREDLAVRIAFRGHDPLGTLFETSAQRIFQPMVPYTEIS